MWADSKKIMDKRLKDSGRDPNKWIVHTDKERDSICIYLIKGLIAFIDCNRWYVHVPNFFERLLGITFQQKLNKVYNKAQKIADKLNEKEAILDKYVFTLNNDKKEY